MIHFNHLINMPIFTNLSKNSLSIKIVTQVENSSQLNLFT